MKRLLAAAMLSGAVGMAAAGATAGASERVRLCHFTGDDRTPYNVIEISASGAYHAHYPHHSDIIPPFEYRGDTYSRNWDAEGRATWNNDCVPTAAPGGGDDPPQDRPNAVRGKPTFTG